MITFLLQYSTGTLVPVWDVPARPKFPSWDAESRSAVMCRPHMHDGRARFQIPARCRIWSRQRHSRAKQPANAKHKSQVSDLRESFEIKHFGKSCIKIPIFNQANSFFCFGFRLGSMGR